MPCPGCLHSDYCFFHGCALWLAFAVGGKTDPQQAPASGDTQPCRCAGASPGAEGKTPNPMNISGAAA